MKNETKYYYIKPPGSSFKPVTKDPGDLQCGCGLRYTKGMFKYIGKVFTENDISQTLERSGRLRVFNWYWCPHLYVKITDPEQLSVVHVLYGAPNE